LAAPQASGGGGSGTVTSVGLSLPAIFAVSGSPVTSTGTLTGSLATQGANTVWAGPASGAAASPGFRALVGADLPTPTSSTPGGVQSKAAVTSNWLRSLGTDGALTASQPNFSDIAGTASISQGGTGATTASAARTNLGLGSAATLDVGTSANKVVQLDGSARLPAVDGSQLTNLPGGGGGGSVPADLDILLAELALGLADALNVAQFLGSAGNRFADSFDATTYVDTGGATNLDTGTAGLLKPTVSGGSDIFPAMTGGTTSGVTITDSVHLDSTSVGWKVGNNANGNTAADSWATDGTGQPWWVKADFGDGTGGTPGAQTIIEWTIANSGNTTGTWNTFSPKDFKLQGSNDNSAWSDLDTHTNVTSWGSPETKTYTLGSPGSYRYYRVYITASNGSPYAMVGEIELKVAGSTNNITVKSTALTAASAPTSMRLVARTKHIDSITLNTDLIFAVSRDGGTTFTNATMNDRFTANAIHVLESSAIDVSGQPSGTSIKWKVTTANNKSVEIHDIYVYWT
jgi:hypothetical protein